MCIDRSLFAAFCTFALTVSVSAAEDQPAKCPEPAVGHYAGSCEALEFEDVAASKHAGDVWIRCEEESGAHGQGGQAAAMFLAVDGRMYWEDEIDSYLAALQKVLSPGAFRKLKREHGRWEKGLQKEIDRANEEAAEEQAEGSAALYAGAEKSLAIIRQHALKLGCIIESRSR